MFSGRFILTVNCFSCLSDELNPGTSFILTLKPNELDDESALNGSQETENMTGHHMLYLLKSTASKVFSNVCFPVGSLTEPFSLKSWIFIHAIGTLLVYKYTLAVRAF